MKLLDINEPSNYQSSAPHTPCWVTNVCVCLLYLNPRKDWRINPKKSKKKIKIKIKLKSPISKHHTTLLCNYYIGRGNQPKKIKKKSKKNQNKIKKKSKIKSN